MPMVDLKLSPKQQSEEAAITEPKEPEYPYQLRITFEQEQLDALGVGLEDFEVGDTFEAKTRFKVVSITSYSSEREDGADKSDSVGLVVAAIETGTSNSEAAKKLFGSKEEA